MCAEQREENQPMKHGVSPPVSLIISPNRAQHFTSVSLSLSCEDQRKSDRWTVRRYTDSWRLLEGCSSSVWGSPTGSTCTISSTIASGTGVYWCQSESGENSHPVNITVHSGVILESPVHPVTEEDTLTLHCLDKYSTPPNLRADFYKDGSLIQSQTTEMIISTVSKSHEGFYYCKHPERGESPKSWISVRERPKPKVSIKPDEHVFGDTVTLRCDIYGEGVTSWRYNWYKDSSGSVFSELQEHTFRSVTESDAGKYFCYGTETEGSRNSQQSDTVTLTVSSYSGRHELLSDSSKGAGGNYTVSSAALNHTGVYACIAETDKPVNYKAFSNTQPLLVTEKTKAKVTIKPDQHVFRGETVTLRCDIDGEGVTSWQYSWYKDSSGYAFSELQEHTFSPVTESDAATYSCYGVERGGSRESLISDAATLTVSDKVQTVLSVSPQKWLTEGDPVTLICEVNGSSTDWTFSWYSVTVSSDYTGHHYKQLSDSKRGAGGNYTVGSVALKHTGVYVCRAERQNPAYYTTISNTQPLWVTGCSPPGSLIIRPNRTQHFTSVSLSLSCEDQSNSDRWTVRRYTESWGLQDCSSSLWGSQTGSTCTISSTIASDTGVYWCQSQSGEKYSLVNITVYFFVILESPVHPVAEGDTLILRCLYKHSTPPNLRADFYKDGSLIQNQTTEMIISNVSKSHEGFYYCKHPERGESPMSWISVRGVSNEPCCIFSPSESQISVLHTLSSILAASPYLLVTVVLIFKCCRIRAVVGRRDQRSRDNKRVQSHVGEVLAPCQWKQESDLKECHFLPDTGSSSSISPSEKVTEDPIGVLSVSPQQWLTEGDPVTLICEVYGSFTDWTFSWYTLSSDINNRYQLLSDSSRGAGGNYTVSSAALNHTGVYVCRAKRGKPAYKTWYSNKQPLWVTGVSPPVSLIISPSRTQHFTSVSLTMSCKDQSNSDRWRMRRYTDIWGLEDCSSSDWGSQTGSTCTINSTSTWDTGVYWCQYETGEISNPVNITVHIFVILESPVHPVTEGDTLTLHCLDEYSTPPNLTADFYKDGSLIQSQTTEMIISTVSKSQEGFYYCKHPERGESPKSWISVRASPDSGSDGLNPVIIGVTAGLTVTFLIIVFLVLLWCYRNNKGGRSQSPSSVSQQQNTSQTLEQNQSEAGNNTLLSVTAHIYDSVDATIRKKDTSTDGLSKTELTYAEIELKSIKKLEENKENKGNNTESCDKVYPKQKLETDQGAGSNDVTYAQIK
ncbi:hypothetical protein QQF64_025366 [Cirrhinus molitorella]|uniref:Ig-like domain-containing protein n=1 Tax=Cirrhinus molitorella TaxID=172907 RepID=A0ABR3NPU0_9TELE